MHFLLVTAHPNPNGYTHVMAKHAIDILQSQGHTYTLMDLYSDERKQDYLLLDTKNQPKVDTKRKKITDQITKANCLLFFYPLWRFDAPAILKNRYDINFHSGFAFNYRPGKLLPEKLLTNKKAFYYITAGGPSFFYNTLGRFIIRTVTRMGRCNYVGIGVKHWRIFGDMHKYREEQDRQYILETITKHINNI